MAENRQSLDRLTAFSDGVFAIASTVLVLQITVPGLGDHTSGARLRSELAGQSGQFLSYAATFVVIAAFWQQHRRLFRLAVRHDEWAARLNSAFLLLIAFLPFPSALVGRYGTNTTAVVFFDLSVIAVGCVFVVLLLRLHFAGHLGGRLPPAYRDWIMVRTLSVCGVLAASAAVALVSPSAATYLWLAIPLVLVGVNLRYRSVIRRAAVAQDDPSG
ncbi:TMEM175 family protein [Streptantibioticus silvisoli]|uniref:TMEM175 family protein n=1 Tax=Streptantibioticus silvisoli TaxID=2705255 RepID=A0ABT6W737_9ACTN|nr:TMEM175 family protein [Streptantibioticus silvisoli]MDI5966548.1 TMEM175 family protein [Streptantibioticus silvisoli]